MTAPVTMKMADFARLKKLLALATSDSDPEALSALRAATQLVRGYGLTWEMVLDKRVAVLAAVEFAGDEVAPLPSSRTKAEPAGGGEAELEEGDFVLAMSGAHGSFLEMLQDIYEKWNDGAALSLRQHQVVENAAERAAARHPGGRR